MDLVPKLKHEDTLKNVHKNFEEQNCVFFGIIVIFDIIV